MNKHYFQTPTETLGTLHYNADRQTYKAVCTSIFEHFTSGELNFTSQQLCYQQVLTEAIATTTTSFTLPYRGIKWTETNMKTRTMRQCFRKDFS